MHEAELAPIFFEIALLVLMAAALGLAGLALRQPLVVAFIAAGVLAGPEMLGFVRSEDFIALLSQISIAVLLFLVGLKLDVGLIRSLGAVAVVAGLGQMALSTGLGMALAMALGLEALQAFYVALALGFSSTIIIVKLLSDKETGRVVQEKRIELQRTTTGEQAAEVRAEAPENVVTVYRIPAKQVAELRALQAKYLAMPQSRQQTIGGSLSIDVTGCKLDAADTGEMLISTYLKTSELETFVALAENFDLRNTQASGRNDLDNTIPPCS